jgi:hypothetical protein
LPAAPGSEGIPHLQRKGAAAQLIVNGRPFLMRGIEFSNNVYDAPDDLPWLPSMLDAYKSYAVNTVLVPICWKHLEPKEGVFDFRMIDTLIDECRRRELRVIVLWFGAIKNGGIGYAPMWFAGDKKRFFRARRPDGKEIFPISPFCEAAIESDARAFVKLMDRIKEKDSHHDTVIMVQPENETGCQQIDNDRDYSETATRAWSSPVPEDLAKHLQAEDGRLIRWLQDLWERNGKKTTGTWPELFGAGSDGQKVFMSYHTGRFIEKVAAAGKAVYPLPMFINDWLGSIQSPGGPIGGPDYQVMDVYRVTTPSAFALCPDIYQENFKAWLNAFDQKGNPILVPEARSDARAAQQCWHTYFQHDGLLFSPYMLVPGEADQKFVATNLTYSNLKMSYEAIAEMEQLILAKQGLRPRELLCFELDKNESPDTVFKADFHGFTVTAKATRGWGKLWEGEQQETPAFAAILKMGENDFVVIGKTMRVEFQRAGMRVASLAKGLFRDQMWVNESPQEVTTETASVVVLTEAFEALDQWHIVLRQQ